MIILFFEGIRLFGHRLPKFARFVFRFIIFGLFLLHFIVKID
jgi:hypothetical protein